MSPVPLVLSLFVWVFPPVPRVLFPFILFSLSLLCWQFVVLLSPCVLVSLTFCKLRIPCPVICWVFSLVSVPSLVLSCPDLQAELLVFPLSLPCCRACAVPETSLSGWRVVRSVRPPLLTTGLLLRCLHCSLAVSLPGLDSVAVHPGLPVYKSFPAYCLDCLLPSSPSLSCLQVCPIKLLTLTLHLSPSSRSVTYSLLEYFFCNVSTLKYFKSMLICIYVMSMVM